MDLIYKCRHFGHWRQFVVECQIMSNSAAENATSRSIVCIHIACIFFMYLSTNNEKDTICCLQRRKVGEALPVGLYFQVLNQLLTAILDNIYARC